MPDTVTLKREDADTLRKIVEEFYLKNELSPEEDRAFLNLCSAGDFGRPVRQHGSGPLFKHGDDRS